MPTYEVIINRKHQDFNKAWNECKRSFYRTSRAYMEKQQKPLSKNN